MQDFWNQRYGEDRFAYGEEPNQYLSAKLTLLPVGKILFPAEGEGRNAVFAAKMGWEAFAFDMSSEGKRKADLLADKNGVTIDYVVGEVGEVDYPKDYFDAIAFSFVHFPPRKRTEYHRKLASFVKKGGTLILEGFGKEHLKRQQENPNAGGPKDKGMLYNLEELKSDFRDFDLLDAYGIETELNEGLYHVGKASVVRIFATKKYQL